MYYIKLNNKGNVSILFLLILTSLLSATALAIDIGLVYVEKTTLSNAVDAAALAGALELPENPEAAKLIAIDYLEKNQSEIVHSQVYISEDNKSIQVLAENSVNHVFAVVFGKEHSLVSVSSKAIIGPARSVTGARPIGVESFDYTYGDTVVLKEGAGNGYHGNYGAIALGGSGSSNFEHNVINGYDESLFIGDQVDTEPGNMMGAVNAIQNYLSDDLSTFENFDTNSKRIWILPLVETMQIDGRNKITIIGFAQFFVEGVQKNSSHMEIVGRFIRMATNAEIDTSLPDKGTYGIKLVK